MNFTRRDFLKQTSALSIISSTGLLITPSSFAQTPKRGGRLRVGLGHGQTTDSIDPGKIGTNGFLGVINYAKHNHLADVNDEGVLSPELAESWESDKNLTEWIFNLKKDVVFHNGKTMTADDVVASINYHRDENSSSAARPLLSNIEDIKADGANTVRFILKAGNADFPYIISDQHLMILPSTDGKTDWENWHGTGPFILKEFKPGVRAFFIRNPDYFKQGQPYFDEMELLTIADSTARTNALITGDVDLIDKVELKTAHLLTKKPGIVLEETKGKLHYTLPAFSNVAPFDNNDVRQALKYALNREQMLESVLYGHGSVGNDNPINQLYPEFNSNIDQTQYDPDKAKFHLKNAGMENLKVSLHLADAAFAGAIDAGVLYQESARKAGIEIDVVREPNDGYWSDVWLKKPWCGSYWLGRTSTYAVFRDLYAEDADWNESHFKNERFSQLLKEVPTIQDQQLRTEIFHEMQQLIHDNSGEIIPLFGNYVFASSDKLQHGPLRGDRDLDGQKFSERWWFD